VRLCREELASLNSSAQRPAFSPDDLFERIVEPVAGPGLGRSIEIADSSIALVSQSCARCQRELGAVLCVKVLRFGDPPQLGGVAALHGLQLFDLIAGELPGAGVDVAAAVD